MMDPQIGIYVVIFVVFIIIMAVSMLGIKEKTYEEAIAEQRKLPEEHQLLGRSAKDKARDKKQKKAGKKVKEKSSDHEKTERPDGASKAAVTPSLQEKVHVDFEEPEAEVVSERPPQEEKRKKKIDRVKPILLNKEEQSLIVEAPVTPTNHFEEILPKDDFLLKRKESREDISVKENESTAHEAPKGSKNKANTVAGSKATVAKTEKIEKVQSSKQERSTTPAAKEHKEPAAPKQERLAAAPKETKESAAKQEKVPKQEKIGVTNPPPAHAVNPASASTSTSNYSGPISSKQEPQTPPPAKERSRKKRSELATLQQMSGNNDGVNVSLLMPLVQKAVLSRSEIQILIDLLLNKQQGSAVSSSEWIQSRQDLTVKLKKQLSEKEKALAEQQDAHQALESKLKELRTELNSERSRLSHNVRQLEEALAAKQNEVQTLGVRLQHSHDNTAVEKQALTQQVQQLQQKLNEEHVRLRASQEEQTTLSQELLAQRQQLELHIGHLSEQETSLKNQVAQLEGMNATLTAELQAQQSRVAHVEGQLLHYKESADHAQDLARQVEELTIMRADLEHRMNTSQQHDAALQFETKNLRSKLEDLQEQLASKDATLQELRSENDKLASQLAASKEIQMELQHLREENSMLSSQSLLLSEMQQEAQQLREENESLAAQVTAVTERPAAEGRENGDLHYLEEKQQSFVQEDRLQHDTIVKQKEAMIGQLEEELKKRDSLLEELTAELNTYKTDITKLKEELEDQRERNNETARKVRQEEQAAFRQLLQRIFPEIKITEEKVHEDWIEQFESHARELLAELKSHPQHSTSPSEESSTALEELEKQNNRLQGLVTYYKTIVVDTEGMLKKLQTHVEQEEANWRQQMQQKESELEAALERQETSSHQEMQSKLHELEEKLAVQEREKHELGCKYEAVRSSCSELEESRSELASQLEREIERRQDLGQEVIKLRGLVESGKDALSQEQAMVLQLQEQVDKVNGINQNHNVASNGPASESAISEGGSGKK